MKIIRDTREKHGWQFPFNEAEIVSRKLNAGDYTTELLEDFIVIERKASVSEIANNLGKKTAKARFHREFERMETLHKAYIICEFPESSIYEYPHNCGFTQAQLSAIRINGKYLRRLLSEIENQYINVEVIFCNNRDEAENVAYDLLQLWESKIQ